MDDIIRRRVPPEPWAEADNIPWSDRAFSRRMLAEHLSQAHDAASWRLSVIAEHVSWIHRAILNERPSRILDLACGPGLYANRLASLGHDLVGIDYSPASIQHATGNARRDGHSARFIEADIRTADFAGPHELAMLLSGEINVFQPESALQILIRAAAALQPKGRILLEMSTVESIRMKAARGPRWYTAVAGLWSDGPHLVLEEAFWDGASATTTTRYVVIEAGSAAVQMFGATYKAYHDNEFEEVLRTAGFTSVEFFDGLGTGVRDAGMRVVLATRE